MPTTYSPAIPNLPSPGPQYNRENEEQFRRQLERTLLDMVTYQEQQNADPTSVATHVLATTSALGPQHSVSGLTARQFLAAISATDAKFRAIETADLPSAALTRVSDTNVTLTLGGSPTTALLAATSLTLGWTGQLAVGRGGTGLSTFTAAGGMPYATAATTLGVLAIGASGRWMGSSGSAPQWNAPAALTCTSDTNVTLTLGGSATTALLNAASITVGWSGQLSVARGGLAKSSVAAFAVLYASAANTYAELAPNTAATRKFLRMLGTGSAGQAPAWDTLTAADVLAGTFPAGSFSMPTLAVTATLTLTGATVAGAPTWSSTQSLNTSGSAGSLSAALAYDKLPTGNGSWDTGVGTTATITRALTVSGLLTASAGLTVSGGIASVTGTNPVGAFTATASGTAQYSAAGIQLIASGISDTTQQATWIHHGVVDAGATAGYLAFQQRKADGSYVDTILEYRYDYSPPRWNASKLFEFLGGLSVTGGSISAAGIAATVGALTATTLLASALPAYAAGDKYVVVDASGNFHISAIGPGS
jgi:hypothetical protein